MEKNDSWFHFSLSDVINITGILATLFVAIYFGRWGLLLTRLNMKQADEIAKQEQTIKGWDTLMKYQKHQDRDITMAILLLDSQLMQNADAQQEANTYNEYAYFGDEEKLFGALLALRQLRQDYLSYEKCIYVLDDTLRNRNQYFKDMQKIINDQFNNKALINNRKLLAKWNWLSHVTGNYITTYQMIESVAKIATLPNASDTSVLTFGWIYKANLPDLNRWFEQGDKQALELIKLVIKPDYNVLKPYGPNRVLKYIGHN